MASLTVPGAGWSRVDLDSAGGLSRSGSSGNSGSGGASGEAAGATVGPKGVAIIRELRKLIAVPSVNPDHGAKNPDHVGEGRMAATLLTAFQEAGADECWLDDADTAPGRPNVCVPCARVLERAASEACACAALLVGLCN